MKLSCQEGLLPGATLAEKWAFAQGAGFDALELQAGSAEDFRRRLPDLRAARRSGVVMSTVCLAGGPFIGEFDPDRRKAALGRMELLLEAAAELGASGVVTPAAWGVFSLRLPPHAPPRSPEDDRAVLTEALTRLGEHALSVGSAVLFEPLNRYEDHMVNTLAAAKAYCERVGLESVKVTADLYHMNVEEARIPEAIVQTGHRVGHVHLADSNRLEPGAGHTDFRAALEALKQTGYAGYMGFEGRLSGEAAEVLPKAVRFLRELMT